ncbi:MAG: helix-turn-helix transcriptional regulator [Clostridiales bacterium]|nr:helix-turn-helix transcriptional regulator [Clostridiales bacterium]
MNEEELRKIIARNLAFYRKEKGLTQAELAEMINYSDKSVSKWERGDGLPDVYVLTVLAGLFNITVNDLLSPEEPRPPKKKKRILSRRTSVLIPLLASGLSWFVGTIVYFVLRLLSDEIGRLWLVFIYTAAVSDIVLVVFSHLWWSKPLSCTFVSILIWLAATCVYLTMQLESVWLIFIVAAVLQVLALLWYVYLAGRRKNKQ